MDWRTLPIRTTWRRAANLPTVVSFGILFLATIAAAILLWRAATMPTMTPIFIVWTPSQELSTTDIENVCGLAAVTGPACEPYEETVTGTASYLDYDLVDTCAARNWKRGTKLLVTAGEKWVVCTVRDYGPTRRDRIVDLNRDQFIQLAPTRQGLVRVSIAVL